MINTAEYMEKRDILLKQTNQVYHQFWKSYVYMAIFAYWGMKYGNYHETGKCSEGGVFFGRVMLYSPIPMVLINLLALYNNRRRSYLARQTAMLVYPLNVVVFLVVLGQDYYAIYYNSVECTSIQVLQQVYFFQGLKT